MSERSFLSLFVRQGFPLSLECIIDSTRSSVVVVDSVSIHCSLPQSSLHLASILSDSFHVDGFQPENRADRVLSCIA